MAEPKNTWSLVITRNPIEVYSSIKGIRKFEPSETMGLSLTLVDINGASATITILNIKPQDFAMEER